MGHVSVVIVAYNSGEFIRRCLATVGSGHGEVVVVDSGSPDGAAGIARDEFPDVRLIARSRNDGFGSAANVGVAATSGRWVLLLNPDAWPIDDAVDQLVQFADGRPGLGATGPLLFSAEGQPQRSTIRPPLGPAPLALWATFPRVLSGAYGLWRRVTSALRRGRVRPAEFLQGAALLLRRDAFEQVGGFDESFFMYGEDADLCARLRDAGWSVALCPSARFVHVGGGSTRGDSERMQLELLRSWLRLIAKLKGIGEAERARRWLLRAMRVRALASRGPRYRDVVSWLASGRAGELLGLPE
ncbi:MAG: glycosyltransferase family 2 protein [Thermoleophilaceae bacterium]|nr:glycosyltransferase family 2 protein [Thermoleophilaceae bacterium]